MKREQDGILRNEERAEADVGALLAEELPEFVAELEEEHFLGRGNIQHSTLKTERACWSAHQNWRAASTSSCSEGTFENSPAFQCRVRVVRNRVPKGRLKNEATPAFSRPFGTQDWAVIFPTLKRRAILGLSLRDASMLSVQFSFLWVRIPPATVSPTANLRAPASARLAEMRARA